MVGVAPEILARIRESESDRDRRILLRGCTILSMDPAVGDLARGDILIAGKVIREIGPDLSAAAADARTIEVDVRGRIAVPGFQDTHRHCWQGQFRRLLSDGDVPDYMRVMHAALGPHYRPEDMHAAHLLTALGAIDTGVTTVMDFSHNARTSEHSDAGVEGWLAGGIRAVHASCGPVLGQWDRQWPTDLRRLRDQYFSSEDQLVTLRIGLMAPALDANGVSFFDQSNIGGVSIEFTEKNLRWARELGLATSVDGCLGPVPSQRVEELHGLGLLGPDITYIHCGDLSEGAWQAIVDTGGSISLALSSDAQIGLGGSVPPIQEALDHGVRPSLGVDAECCLPTDLFTQMHVLLNLQHMKAYSLAFAGDPAAPAPITVRDVLEFVTVRGAHANGLLHKVGTLTPGKEADIVLINAQDINLAPLNHAVGTVVNGADSKNVETVFVAGQVRKWAGRLVGNDLDRVRDVVAESRDYLLAKAGLELDILA